MSTFCAVFTTAVLVYLFSRLSCGKRHTTSSIKKRRLTHNTSRHIFQVLSPGTKQTSKYLDKLASECRLIAISNNSANIFTVKEQVQSFLNRKNNCLVPIQYAGSAFTRCGSTPSSCSPAAPPRLRCWCFTWPIGAATPTSPKSLTTWHKTSPVVIIIIIVELVVVYTAKAVPDKNSSERMSVVEALKKENFG